MRRCAPARSAGYVEYTGTPGLRWLNQAPLRPSRAWTGPRRCIERARPLLPANGFDLEMFPSLGFENSFLRSDPLNNQAKALGLTKLFSHSAHAHCAVARGFRLSFSAPDGYPGLWPGSMACASRSAPGDDAGPHTYRAWPRAGWI